MFITFEFWVAAIALLIAAISLYMAYNCPRKHKVEVQNTDQEMHLSLIEPLQMRIDVLEAQTGKLRIQVSILSAENEEMKTQIGRLRSRVTFLEAENEELMRGIQVLLNQLRALGHEPAWVPKEEPSS